MKNLILAIALGSISYLGQAQVKFEIKGKVTNAGTANNKQIYLSYGNRDNPQIDSALIHNNTFRFKGTTEAGNIGTLSKGQINFRDPSSFTSIHLDKGIIQVNLDLSDLTKTEIIGSKAQDDYDRWEEIQQKHVDQMKPLYEKYNKENQEYILLKREQETLEQQLTLKKDTLESIRNEMQPFSEASQAAAVNYIKQNPNSYTSAYLLRMRLSDLPLEQSEAYYESLTPAVKESMFGKEIVSAIKRIKDGSVGSIASVFTTTDINGQNLSLNDYKGKYVLLDFWASWCVPCRKGNPHLITLHNKYSNLGFEIIGISDDDGNLTAWKKAVDQDQIHIWKHVLRGLKRTESGYDHSSDISDDYGISSLPTKILIDPKGIIVGRYGSNGGTDEDLDKKLKEVFGI